MAYVQDARQAAGLSQTELLVAMANDGVTVNVSELSKWERDLKVPKSRKVVVALAQNLGIDLESLIEHYAAVEAENRKRWFLDRMNDEQAN